ncbi:alpha-N-acetylgalactosaminide alpha-2,6-sialyltransferase 1.1 isoform X1 [Gadus chalcogrammus]|uniref:alpha-N-acetylgalactosaminide alpha-2,6-sialyltransferase 1.1 isoform X1 n=1 Tax=Gadus chalcogrammus TaxID=1042646 RepID=UPI0024C4A465|nr:alpha-N-acetylgalactosaminide alpha-2,6-sialyltransferase 1.1 isoform X1 [Gadus chalcogrammus]
MASRAVRRIVAVLIILTISKCLYMRLQHSKKAGIQQFGEAKDKGFLLTEEEAPKSTLDDDEELTTIEKAELVTKNAVQLTTEDIDEGTSDGNETWLIQHTPTKRSVGPDSETLMPLLQKKDFRKLPQWDFEDVYSRSDQPRQMTCSLSLRMSEDANFTKNFIPNINLFMYNRSVTVREWNRLSHFNNPFGFMGYDYREVVAALRHIPKPQEPMLVARGDGVGCVSCAVVGTAGILSGSGMGKEIDGHDYVFRMNGAITKGYEEDVGNKTSVYLHTAYSLTSALSYYKKHGLPRFARDEGIKYVMIPSGYRDFQWLQALFTGKLVSAGPFKHLRPTQYYTEKLDNKHFYLLHPDFLRYLRNRFLRSPGLNYEFWAVVKPTNGAVALFLALHTCDVVNAYGFITEDYQKYPYTYYKGTVRKMIFYFTHDFITEMNAWKNLHNAGIINLYQRREP